MASRKPKQSLGYKKKEQSSLAKLIKKRLKKFGMKQEDLATSSGMSPSRVSRILNDGPVRLTEHDINQLALALEMTTAERDNLRYLAWPELYEIDKALKRRDGCVFLVNYDLAEQGLPLLGSNFEE